MSMSGRTVGALVALLICCAVADVRGEDTSARPSVPAVSLEQHRQLWIQLNRNNDLETNHKVRRKPVAVTIGAAGVALQPSSPLRPLPPGDPTPLEMLIMNEDRDPSLDPKPAAIKQPRLQRLLGNNYDHEVMSVMRPVEASLRPNGTVVTGPRTSRDRPDVNTAAFDILRTRMQMGKKQFRKVEKLLAAYTDCPVIHVWLDLGLRFWPRWFREARCYQDRTKSCSIPAGMHCTPNDYTNKTILRYHCRAEASSKKSQSCQWISVTVPLITSCRCGCSERQDL